MILWDGFIVTKMSGGERHSHANSVINALFKTNYCVSFIALLIKLVNHQHNSMNPPAEILSICKQTLKSKKCRQHRKIKTRRYQICGRRTFKTVTM